MSNFAIYAQAQNLSSLKTGASASPVTYSEISKSQSYALTGGSTDEVKLSYSAPQNFNCVAITGLNDFPTITVTKTLSASDTALGTISGPDYAATSRARGTFNALLIFADQSADDITLTFSTPYPTGFRTVFAGYLVFQPLDNFEQGVGFVDATDFDTVATRSSSYQTTRSRLRAFNPSMMRLSDDEFHNVNYAKYLIGDDNCLAVLDSSNTSPEMWIVASIAGGSSQLIDDGHNQQNIQFKEANKWL